MSAAQSVEAELRQALEGALATLKEKDATLLRVDANERSLTHRLALHLEQALAGTWLAEYNVDCEYNRSHDIPKRIRELALNPDSADEHARTVFPDIIVHRRNTEQNLLVIEAKKSTNTDPGEADKEKIIAFCRPRPAGGLGYLFGVRVMFHIDRDRPNASILAWHTPSGATA